MATTMAAASRATCLGRLPLLLGIALLVLSGTHQLSVSARPEAHCPNSPNLRAFGRLVPNINRVIAEVINELLPFLASGVPSLGIKPLEPLPVGKISLQSSEGQTLKLLKCALKGASQTKTSNFSIDNTGVTFNHSLWNFNVPNLKLKCHYEMEACFLGVESANRGLFELDIENYYTSYNCSWFFTKGWCGETYTEWTSCQSSFLSAASFVPFFSGLSAAQNAQMDTVTLRQLILDALVSKQARVVAGYTITLFKTMPPRDVWLPPSHAPYVPFCLARRPATC